MKYIKIELLQTYGLETYYFEIQKMCYFMHFDKEEIHIKFCCEGKFHEFYHATYGEFYLSSFDEFLSQTTQGVFVIPMITEEAWLKIDEAK